MHTFLSGGGASLHGPEKFYKRCKFDELIDSEDETGAVIEEKYVGITRGFMSVHFDECDGGDVDIGVKYWGPEAELLYESRI